MPTVLGIIVGLVVAILAIAATRPGTFRVERAASIKAPQEKVFGLINDFHNWRLWSPWENLDPNLNRTYSGPPAGKGAVYEWEGNSKAGKGRMEITDASPASRVVIKLDFIKPFEGHNTTEFTLAQLSGATTVKWAMYGPVTFMGKLMSVFVSMDKFLGKEFEKGLTNLQAVAPK